MINSTDPLRRGRAVIDFRMLSRALLDTPEKRAILGFMDVEYVERRPDVFIVLWQGTSDLFDRIPEGTPTPYYDTALCEAIIDGRKVCWIEVTRRE